MNIDKLIDETVRDLCSVEVRIKSRTRGIITKAFEQAMEAKDAQLKEIYDILYNEELTVTQTILELQRYFRTNKP